MRDPNLGSVIYATGDPTGITTIADLVKFVRDGQIRTANAIQALAAGHLDPLHKAPLKPRAGDIRIADGVDWNPGSVEGIYRYSIAGAWVFVG